MAIYDNATREVLVSKLGEEITKQIESLSGSELKLAIGNNGSFIPKSTYEADIKKVKDGTDANHQNEITKLNEIISGAKTELEQLKQSFTGDTKEKEALQVKIKSMEDALANKTKELETTKSNFINTEKMKSVLKKKELNVAEEYLDFVLDKIKDKATYRDSGELIESEFEITAKGYKEEHKNFFIEEKNIGPSSTEGNKNIFSPELTDKKRRFSELLSKETLNQMESVELQKLSFEVKQLEAKENESK